MSLQAIRKIRKTVQPINNPSEINTLCMMIAAKAVLEGQENVLLTCIRECKQATSEELNQVLAG
jgi:hypothetical protein